ncbi:MAG: D-alanine--D-alanine ligase family protein [Bacteroidota bacterium]
MSTSVALIFGGKSPEHEISIRSAKNIYGAIDKDRYTCHLLGISTQGEWFGLAPDWFEKNGSTIGEGDAPLALLPGNPHPIIYKTDGTPWEHIDVVFPIVHGPNGEDGSLQGLLRLLDLPFAGPDVMASAVAMDKDLCKRVLSQANLLVAEHLTFGIHEREAIDYLSTVNRLGSPVFIKPANMGSSVGVRKAKDKAAFDAAVEEAFLYDRKIIIETMLHGREVECAVLGNELAQMSHIGEVSTPEAYSYEAKYISSTEAKVDIPANITDAQLFKLQMVAKQAYELCGCEGMSRVDMFLCEGDEVYVNEINTLPGFTSISMYPQLWEHAGLSYSDLIQELLELALKRHQERKSLKTVNELT